MKHVVHERCGNVRSSWTFAAEQDVESGGKFLRHELSRNNVKSSSFGVTLWELFRYIFLPEGFPDSVSPDYVDYQFYDTLQALCSSVSGTLSTRAILRGVGVGEAEASVLAGTMQWVVRDGAGMIGRILFASLVSCDLDNDAKRWRLAADITNDLAMMLEIFSSHASKAYFLPLICLASLLRAVTGVAGGATRASLTQHFATRKNTADVSAKDGSQETAVAFLGMFVGMAVASFVPESFFATAAVFLVLTVLHLASNYMGVTSLILTHLNEERFLHCVRSWQAKGKVPTPLEMKRLEGVIFHEKKPLTIKLGVSLESIIRSMPTVAAKTLLLSEKTLKGLKKNKFLAIRFGSSNRAVVVFTTGAEATDVLRGYWDALSFVDAKYNAAGFSEFKELLLQAGWSLDRVQFRVADWRIDSEKTD